MSAEATRIQRMAGGVKSGQHKAIEVGLRRRSEFPSCHMIIRSDGTIYWPQPGEGALKMELMLGPLSDAHGFDWTAGEVLTAIARKQ